MDYEKLVIGIIGVIIGAILNHVLNQIRERRGREYKNKEMALKEVYAPIYKILSPDFGYSSEYKGTTKIKKIEEIVHNNSELVDTQLIQMVKDTKAGIRMVDGPTGEKDDYTVVYDHDKKFFTHIRDKYNSLKKELGLPYDKK